MWVFFGNRKYNISIELWSKVENPYIRTQFFFLNANNKKTVIRFNVTTIFFSNIECLIYFFECLKDFFIDSIVNIHVNTCYALIEFIFESKLVSDIENHQNHNHNDQNDHYCYRHSSPGTSVS